MFTTSGRRSQPCPAVVLCAADATFGDARRCTCMTISISQPSALINARDTAARRCVSLMFATAVAELTSQPVSVEQEIEIEAASDDWEAAGTALLWQD